MIEVSDLKVVYIAGPISGANGWEHEQNVRRAEEMALLVWATRRALAECPHTDSRYISGALPYEVWAAGELVKLARSDAILLMPDWQDSPGARGEELFARERGIRQFRAQYFDKLPPDLLEWLGLPKPMPAVRVELHGGGNG